MNMDFSGLRYSHKLVKYEDRSTHTSKLDKVAPLAGQFQPGEVGQHPVDQSLEITLPETGLNGGHRERSGALRVGN